MRIPVFKPLNTSSLARKRRGLILPMTCLNMLLVRRLGILSTTANRPFVADRSGSTVEVLAIVAKPEAKSWLAQFGNPE